MFRQPYLLAFLLLVACSGKAPPVKTIPRVSDNPPSATRSRADLPPTETATAGEGDEILWVENWDGKTWLQLNLEREVEKPLLDAARDLVPVDEGREIWIAGIDATEAGNLELGSKLSVTDFSGSHTSCTISGFSSINRGRPHFSYIPEAMADTGEPPTYPGCGYPMVFAELTCEGHVSGSEITGWAYRLKKKAPIVYNEEKHPELLESTVKLAMADEMMALDVESMREEVEADELELKIEHRLRSFEGPGGLFWLLETDMWTGYGDDECGADDYVEYRMTLFADDGGKPGKILLPFVDRDKRIFSFVDMEPDGMPEIMVFDEWEAAYDLLVIDVEMETTRASDWGGNGIPNCDCSC